MKQKNAFIQQWISMLWECMSRTGNGYRRFSLRHTGIGDDRRKDKLENESQSKFARSYSKRYQGVSAK